MPILSESQFEKIKQFFKGTRFESNFNKLKTLSATKLFPDILRLDFGENSRYFKLTPHLIVSAGKALLSNNPISAPETEMLKQIKKQLETSQQSIINVLPSDKEKTLNIVMQQEMSKELFEVPSRCAGYLSFALNIAKPRGPGI